MFSLSPVVECGPKHQEKGSDVVPAIGRNGCEVPHEVRRQAHLRTRRLICSPRISPPVAATTRVAPGPGNPRTPAPAPAAGVPRAPNRTFFSRKRPPMTAFLQTFAGGVNHLFCHSFALLGLAPSHQLSHLLFRNVAGT